MRHEIADEATDFTEAQWEAVRAFRDLYQKEQVHTIAPAIVEEKDYTAFAAGLGVLLAIVVFALWLLL